MCRAAKIARAVPQRRIHWPCARVPQAIDCSADQIDDRRIFDHDRHRALELLHSLFMRKFFVLFFGASYPSRNFPVRPAPRANTIISVSPCGALAKKRRVTDSRNVMTSASSQTLPELKLRRAQYFLNYSTECVFAAGPGWTRLGHLEGTTIDPQFGFQRSLILSARPFIPYLRRRRR